MTWDGARVLLALKGHELCRPTPGQLFMEKPLRLLVFTTQHLNRVEGIGRARVCMCVCTSVHACENSVPFFFFF